MLLMESGCVWRLKPDLLVFGFECPLPDTRDGRVLAGMPISTFKIFHDTEDP
jgi:hypothetical protein